MAKEFIALGKKAKHPSKYKFHISKNITETEY